MVLSFIAAYTAEHGTPPSVREIGDAVGLSSTGHVQYILTRLVERGVLRHTFGKGYALTSATVTAAAIELAWCESTHGQRPPKVRPCKRHRLMAEWLAEIVLPKARVIAAIGRAA